MRLKLSTFLLTFIFCVCSQPASFADATSDYKLFEAELKLAAKYKSENDIAQALNCYVRATKLSRWGSGRFDLLRDLQDLLTKDPLNPFIHLAYAEALLAPDSVDQENIEALVHLRRAKYLSVDHANEKAEELIKKLEMIEPKTISNESAKVMKTFNAELCKNWQPPQTTGYQLVRLQVPVTYRGIAREITCWCPSGNPEFDQSALTLLKKTKYKTLIGYTGLLDFAFVADDGKTSVSYVVYCGGVVP